MRYWDLAKETAGKERRSFFSFKIKYERRGNSTAFCKSATKAFSELNNLIVTKTTQMETKLTAKLDQVSNTTVTKIEKLED